MKYYTASSLSALMNEYASMGGEIYELEEGALGYGLTVCILDGYKSAVIQEHYVNPWTCGHTCRFYNILPKKYQRMIESEAV